MDELVCTCISINDHQQKSTLPQCVCVCVCEPHFDFFLDKHSLEQTQQLDSNYLHMNDINFNFTKIKR